MATAQEEHRGWEISTDYHEHWADDVDYDLAEDGSDDSHLGALVAVAVITILLAIGTHLLGKWLEPPSLVVNIPAPQIINRTEQSGAYLGPWGPIPVDWKYSHLAIDAKAKTVTGNCKEFR